jgi:hypothetical protein
MLLDGRPPEHLPHCVVDASSALKVGPKGIELVRSGKPVVQEEVESFLVGGIGGQLFEREATNNQFALLAVDGTQARLRNRHALQSKIEVCISHGSVSSVRRMRVNTGSDAERGASGHRCRTEPNRTGRKLFNVKLLFN